MEAVSDLDGCFYVSALGHTWAWTHILPTLITLSLTVVSLRLHGYEWFPTIYGMYLHYCQLLLWALQLLWKSMRPHPYCAEIHTYSFPSQEAFFVASLATYLIVYSYVWRIPMAIFTWLFIICIVVFPPIVLVFFQYNRPMEIVWSMVLGIGSTVPFVLIIRYYIKPWLPYLLNQPPWCWLSYIDTYICNKREQQYTVFVGQCVKRCERVIAVRARGRHSCGCH